MQAVAEFLSNCKNRAGKGCSTRNRAKETKVCHDRGKVLKCCCSLEGSNLCCWKRSYLLLMLVLGIGEGRVAREKGKGLCLNCSPLGYKGVSASLLKSDEESIPPRLL